MKKRITLLLAIAMLFALSVPCFSIPAVAETDDGAEAVLMSSDGIEFERGAFDDIVKMAQPGDVIKLLSDVLTRTQISLHGDNITLDGDGHTIYYGGTDYIFHICGGDASYHGGDNTCDDKPVGTVYLNNFTAKFIADRAGGIKTYNRTSLHCENVNIFSDDLGHLSARNCKSDDITYTYINCNFITTGQAIFTFRPDQTLNIYGGYFESHTARALRVNDGMTANIYGAIFATRNLNSDSAAAKSTGNLNMAGCTFINFNGADTFITEEGKGTTIGADSSLILNTTEGNYSIATLLEGVKLNISGGTPASTSNTSIKFGGSVKDNGIRFRTTVDSAAIARANSLKDDDTKISFGTLIVPIEYLDGQTIFNEGVAKLVGCEYIDIKAKDGIVNELNGDVVLNAALVDIKAEHVNTEFTAVAYFEYVRDGITVREYGLYDAVANTASIAGLAVEAEADVSATETATHMYKTADGKYSPYTAEQQAVIAAYADLAK